MELYCLNCKKLTKNINPQVSSSSNGKFMVLSKCAKCGSRKSKFINKQEVKGLLHNLGIKTPLSKLPVLGDILFLIQFHWSCIKRHSSSTSYRPLSSTSQFVNNKENMQLADEL